MKRRALACAAGALAALAGLLGVLELALRVQAEASLQVPPGLVRTHPTRRYALTPGFHGVGNGYPVIISTQGFRDRVMEVPKPTQTRRIICVGDSFTYGANIALDETYPKQLERLLNDGRPPAIDVLNAGVPSYNTVSELRFVQEDLLRYEPDLLLVQFHFGDVIPLAFAIPVTNPVLNVIKDALRPLYSYNFLAARYYALTGRLKGLASGTSGQDDSYLEAFQEDNPGWRACREALDGLKQIDAARVPIVLMIQPLLDYPGPAYPYRAIHQTVARTWGRDDRVIDLLEVLEGREARTFWAHPSNPHPNAQWNRLIAQRVLSYLEQQGILRGWGRGASG